MSQHSSAVSFSLDTPELAATYDETGVRQFEHGKILISALGIGAGNVVLDVGAGTGRLAEHVAGLVGPQGRVVAIDPLPERIAIARTKAAGNLDASVGRAEDLSAFADGSFDVVYLNSVFHWVPDKARALAEFFRVLRPGGRLGLNTQTPEKPHELHPFVRQAFAETGIAREAIRSQGALGIDDHTLSGLFSQAGFVGYDAQVHTLVDLHSDVATLLAWSTSSSFGNFLAGITPADKARLQSVLAQLLEARRTPEGIRLERYLLFATARKPE